MSKLKSTRLNSARKQRGMLLTEHLAVVYVLFFLLFFPLLNYSVTGFRVFLLWCAANYAVNSACTAKTYLKPVPLSADTNSPSACEIAQMKSNQIRKMFPGIDWDDSENNPDVQIVREPLNPNAKNAKPAAVFSRGHGAPLSAIETPDRSQDVYLCRVIIKGRIYPFISIPWFDIPGLSKPFPVTVRSESQYENVAGLIM